MSSRYSVFVDFKARDRFAGTMQRMENRTKRMTRGMKAGMVGVQRFATGAVGALRQVGMYAGIAGAAVGALALHVVKVGSGFEEAMSGVGAVMLKSTGEIEALADKAKDLGRVTKFTGAQVAEGMELMARAGFKEKDILEGIEGVLSAAAASGMELAETAGIVSNVLKGMGLETSRATDVADVLALASSRTNSTIGSLGESMSNVASTARQLGIPLKDTVAAVALLQDVGLDASVAGSSLNTMLTRLSKPTAGLKREMKRMGVEFQDSKGNMLPIVDVMENMAKAAEKSGGNMKQMAFFADLVGLRGQKAAANLKDLFVSGKFRELRLELEGSAGAAKKMADLKLDNLRGDFTKLLSAVDAFETKLFEMNGGPLRDFVQWTTDWVTSLEKNPLEDLGLDSSTMADIEDVIDQLKTLGEIFSKSFLDVMGAFGTSGKTVKEWFRNIDSPATRDLAEDLGMAAAGFLQFAIFLGKALGLLFGVGGGVKKGIGEPIKEVGKDIGGLGQEFGGMFDDIKAIFGSNELTLGQKMQRLVSVLIKNLLAGLKANEKLILDVSVNLGTNIVWGIAKAIDERFVNETYNAFKRNEARFIEGMKELAKNAVKGFLNGITDMIEKVKDTAKGFGKAFMKALKGKGGLDSHSPSRKMEEEAMNAAAGWERGAAKAAKRSKRSMQSMTGLPSRGHMRMVYSASQDVERQPMTSVAASQVARSVEESTLTRNAVITVQAKQGTDAEITEQPKGTGVTLKLKPTGTFDP